MNKLIIAGLFCLFINLIFLQFFSWKSTQNQINYNHNFSQVVNEIKEEQVSKKLVIFLHVGTVGQKWYSQAEYMINALNKSGLLEEANHAFLYVVGKPDREIKFEKFKIFWATDNPALWEFPTIQSLFSFSQNEEDYNILYLHNKGATKTSTNVDDWIDVLLYFNVYKWREVIQFLNKGYSVACINFRVSPTLHCSGNFWWTRSHYIRNLPFPHGTYRIVPDYPESVSAEFWIGAGINEKTWSEDVCQLHATNFDHYLFPYPPEKYMTNSSLNCINPNTLIS